MPLNVSAPIGVNNFGGVINENAVASVNGSNGINGGISTAAVTGSGWGEPTQSNNSNIDMGTSRWGANEHSINGNNGGLMWPSQQPEKNEDVMTADAMVIFLLI